MINEALVEAQVLFSLIAASEWDGFLNALPIIVSSIVAGIGGYITLQLRRDKAKTDKVAADAARNKADLDTLTLGQAWVVDALERSEKDNERLRERIETMETDHAEEIAAIRKEMSECHKECRELRRELEKK